MRKILLLTLFVFSIGILLSQPNFPSELNTSFSIKWTQDKIEGEHKIDLSKINIFVFTSTLEDPASNKSSIYKFYKDLDILLDPNSKEKPESANVTPGKFNDYAPEINTYLVYVGKDYNTYKAFSRGALSKSKIYKRCTNIVYLDDIKTSSFKDFQVGDVSTCVASVYDNAGKFSAKWSAGDNQPLAFDKIYKKGLKPSINGRLLTLQSGKKQPLTNASVSLVKINTAKVVKKVNTDKNGDFRFELPDGTKGYSLNIQPASDEVRYIFLTNQKGEELKKIIRSKDGFNYNLIDADVVKLAPVEEEDPALTAPVKINGKILNDNKGLKTPLMNTSVSVVNSNTNKVIGTTVTDKYGDFSLNVSKDIANYNLVVDPESKDIDNIIITDQGGFEIMKISRTGGSFKYNFISSDINLLSDVPEEDIKLSFNKLSTSNKTDLEISKSINYSFNEIKFNKDAEPILNKIVTILNENPTVILEVISHTDSQGDDNSNLTLSKNRSNSVIEYFVSKGIAAKRLKAIGKGESNIRNRCTNGIDCSDKEHEYNRRTEFHFLKK